MGGAAAGNGLLLRISRSDRSNSPLRVLMVWNSFNLGTTAHGSSMCVGAIGGVDLQLGNGVWLLGDRYDFLR